MEMLQIEQEIANLGKKVRFFGRISNLIIHLIDRIFRLVMANLPSRTWLAEASPCSYRLPGLHGIEHHC